MSETQEDATLHRIFLECLASTSPVSSVSFLQSTSAAVSVDSLVDYIRDNAPGSIRNDALLDDLQKSIKEVSSDGQVTWTLFKKAAKRWITNYLRCNQQDGNNNVRKNGYKSDDTKFDSRDVGKDHRECAVLRNNGRKSMTSQRFVAVEFMDLLNVSSYSPNSETTHGEIMSDTTPDSADEIDGSCSGGNGGEGTQIDLRQRVRRFDEENMLLREELVRAEELAAGHQRHFEALRRKLEQSTEKCKQLERENDEKNEVLQEAERKERACKFALQKVEKDREAMKKKLEDAETQKQQIISLNLKLERCTKKKLECITEAVACRQMYEEKQTECEMLREKLSKIEEANTKLAFSYEETIRHLREKNEELKNLTYDLQTGQGINSPSNGICSPPSVGCVNSYMQSSPSKNPSIELQDSLYTELKASGFPVDDSRQESKIRELEDELCWYNEEIRAAVKQIENVIVPLSRMRRNPSASKLHLDNSIDEKTTDIYTLLRRISLLSSTVNDVICKPKVKDAACHVRADTISTPQQLSEFGILSFENCKNLINAKRTREIEGGEKTKPRGNDVFLEAFSMNSHSLAEDVEEVKVTVNADCYPDTDRVSPSGKESMLYHTEIQGHEIIDPIVEELDRILQCTNIKSEEKPKSRVCTPPKNRRYRCPYNYTLSEPDPHIAEGDRSAADSMLSLPKHSERDLAATYLISAGDDGLSLVNNSNTNGNIKNHGYLMSKTVISDHSNALVANSATESMLTSVNLDDSKTDHDDVFTEGVITSISQDSKSNLQNLSPSPLHTGFTEYSAPQGIDENIVTDSVNSSKTDSSRYCVTPNQNLRIFPKRKISVFHRSFQIDTLQGDLEFGGATENYRLTERSMSTPSDRDQEKINSMEEDLKRPETTPASPSFLLNTYRTNDDNNDSFSSSSSIKAESYHQDYTSLSEDTCPAITKPIVLAPTRLKLPLLREIPPYSGSNRNSTETFTSPDTCNEQAQVSKTLKVEEKCMTDDVASENNKITETLDNETRENDSTLNEISNVLESTRPVNDIKNGITHRELSFYQDSDCRPYSLLSSLDDRTPDNEVEQKTVSSHVVTLDSDSTSCDSSPQRTSPATQDVRQLPLYLTYDKPRNEKSEFPDPLKSRGTRSVDRMIENSSYSDGFERRNDSIRNVGSFVGGGGRSDGIRTPGEKPSDSVPAVAIAMSSGEDSSDSECDPMGIKGDEDRRNVDESRSISPNILPFVDGAFLGSSTPAIEEKAKNDQTTGERFNSGPTFLMTLKRDKKEPVRRSLSDGGNGNSQFCSRCITGDSNQTESTKEETRTTVFPSLTDERLQESGIAVLSNTNELRENCSEDELERKYTALSIGLGTDRVTLPRRVALSIRQRDQSERNLSCEVQKMHQDIEDLAPLCIDRESVERVERVRHQLEMITQCAHRVSCTAETLGAVHQENRISRAAMLADRYLQVLRSRCEKLAGDLAETKRILAENNIVVEENNGDLGDDMPRMRYRGMPTNNRTMMARRRASIATIFRPLGNFQDVAKDGLRQRNSVSGRMTVRRPSLSAESQKWDADKLDRTDSSSSSIGELREIFEQAESRRNSREENNNVLRLHSSNQGVQNYDNGDREARLNMRDEPVAELPVTVEGCRDSSLTRRTSLVNWATTNNVQWGPMIWYILISFFLGFFMKHVVSSVGCSGPPLKWSSIQEILGHYVQVKNNAPRPI